MTVQITIIGLGQIGSSIGLALKAHNVDARIVGHDKDLQTAKEAQKMGAIDDVKYNLPSSVRGANVVIMALPFAALRETLEIIAPDLQAEALVLDTAPSKATVAAWAKELLPQQRYYVGLTPAVGPEYMHGAEFGVKAARADLFNKGLIVVNTPSGTPGHMFNLAMEMVGLFGAMPLVMDAAEADGIFAAIHMLPQLAATALLDATVDKPGWQEARKLAGRPYASATSGVSNQEDLISLRDAVLENRENVVRLLNNYIISLIDLRDEIDDKDSKALTERLGNALRGRDRWFSERRVADWANRQGEQVDGVLLSDRMSQMFLGSRAGGKKRK